ncbi:MAG: RNA polymerase sigma factor [Thiohalospira sp.]
MEYIVDEQLMGKVKDGNLDALAPLFEKYHVKLYNFFLRLCRNREISKDLTQNVFQRIIAYRDSYNEQWKFRTWMYQIARNVLFKHYQENKFLQSDYFEPEHMMQDEKTAIEEMDFESKKNNLFEALSQLTPEQQEIIELSKFQGLKYQEISEITGSSVTAIKVKVHRAIQKLKEVYFELA